MKNNPSIALPKGVHVNTDTYGGNNTANQIAQDFANPNAAAVRGQADVVAQGNQAGLDLSGSARKVREMTTGSTVGQVAPLAGAALTPVAGAAAQNSPPQKNP